MLSGIKFIPRDQLVSAIGSESDEEMRNSKKKESRDRRKKKEKKKKRRREYSSDSDEESDDSLESVSDSGGERRSKRKRRGRKKDRSSKNYSSDDDEYEKRKEGKKLKKELSDDDGGEVLVRKEKELARKEMGLEWMLNSGNRLDKKAKENESEPEEPQVEEVKTANPRELNPYLKDDGSGYPESSSQAGPGQLLSSSVVGDGGASWRLKALKRAKEQAAREGRKLDEIVEERWGSLGQLAVTLTGQRVAPVHAHLHAIKDRRRVQSETPESIEGSEMQKDTGDIRRVPRSYLRDVSTRNPEMKKPQKESVHWKKNKQPNVPSEDRILISAAISGINKFSDDGSFMEKIGRLQNSQDNPCNSSHVGKETNDGEDYSGASRCRHSNETSSINVQGLTANQLAAKVLQLRMKGKHAEAEQLSKEMKAMSDTPTEKNTARQEAKGTTSRYIEKQISSERKKREEDADFHLAKSIMQNKKYSMSSSSRADDEYDYDGDAPSRKQNRKREGSKQEEKRNIPKRILTQQERCQFCFENPSRPKHLVVAIGNFTYMMLPQYQPVVQGHCCILPMQHDSSTRTIDKNVGEELRNFKKCLLRMFAEQEKDVLFIETVIGLSQQRRHCLIECIPVPYAVAKQAPMYFKKAIDEAEDEWGQHEMKKVISTSGNLRNVIPENMAYFHVEFGLDRGFVHVIDDDANFSSNFGLNIVRGMLRLPEEDMHRRRRQETVENQRQAVASFVKDWDPFDWTKDLE